MWTRMFQMSDVSDDQSTHLHALHATCSLTSHIRSHRIYHRRGRGDGKISGRCCRRRRRRLAARRRGGRVELGAELVGVDAVLAHPLLEHVAAGEPLRRHLGREADARGDGRELRLRRRGHSLYAAARRLSWPVGAPLRRVGGSSASKAPPSAARSAAPPPPSGEGSAERILRRRREPPHDAIAGRFGDGSVASASRQLTARSSPIRLSLEFVWCTCVSWPHSTAAAAAEGDSGESGSGGAGPAGSTRPSSASTAAARADGDSGDSDRVSGGVGAPPRFACTSSAAAAERTGARRAAASPPPRPRGGCTPGAVPGRTSPSRRWAKSRPQGAGQRGARQSSTYFGGEFGRPVGVGSHSRAAPLAALDAALLHAPSSGPLFAPAPRLPRSHHDDGAPPHVQRRDRRRGAGRRAVHRRARRARTCTTCRGR